MKKVAVVVIVLVSISFILPTYLWVRDFVIGNGNHVDSEVASQFASVIGAVIAFWSFGLNVVLVYIAYKAFENFDVKKQYHNSQLEIMSQLTREVAEFEFRVMFYRPSVDPWGEKHSIAEGWRHNFFDMISFKYRSDQVFYGRSRNMENFMPFLKYRNHPLVPRYIADQLFKLYKPFHYMIGSTDEKVNDDYRAVFYSDLVPADELLSNSLYKISDNAEEYINECRELQSLIKKWFEKYGADDVNI
ncbi:hypothetical protein ACXOI2_003635 [Vibrio cholerae]